MRVLHALEEAEVAVLLSGGVDSAACVQFFREVGRPTCALFIDYQQAAVRQEYAAAKALTEHFGADARWTKPEGGLFIWATLDERIDTTDLLALARESEGVAFVPGRAAYMDGRSGASSMRLNFAGVPDDDIREGIRRIGRVVREQVGLYGSLAGSAPSTPAAEGSATTDLEFTPCLADVVALPQAAAQRARRHRQDR